MNESLEGLAEKGRVSHLTFVHTDEDVDGQPDVSERSFRAHDFMPLRREVCAAFDDLRDQVRFQAVITTCGERTFANPTSFRGLPTRLSGGPGDS